MPTTAQLNAFAILEGFPEDILNRIGQASQLLDFARGDVILEEGHDATHMHGVVAGEVEQVAGQAAGHVHVGEGLHLGVCTPQPPRRRCCAPR